ncbi:MAG TPA: MFS transporter [Candidatus Mediterraneibacter intestinavium]|nr:MFS transporter [Candidatus Mediterraneibacter intestinavium]
MNAEHKKGWRRNAVLFLVSQSITLFGSTLVQMAVVWYVTLSTSSGAWTAAFSICSYLPQFLISIPGGVWADRFSRKRLIISSDLFTALITLAMIVLMPYLSTEPSLLSGLLLMSVLRSLCAGIQTPAVNAALPQLVPAGQLQRFNGINAAFQSFVQFAAPAAAGAVLSFGTLRMTLLIDIFTAIPGIILLSAVPLSGEHPGELSAESSGNLSGRSSGLSRRSSGLSRRGSQRFSSALKTGLSYAFSHSPVRRLLILYGLFVFLCVPAGFLSGLLVSRAYGSSYGYLTAAELAGFAGMTAGGALMGTWGGFSRKEKTLSAGLVLFGAMTVLMGTTPDFPLYLVFMLVYGIALTAVQTTITTLLQECTDASVRGRVFGMLGSMYSGFLPLGMAVFGPLSDQMPLQWIMTASGIFLICTGLRVRVSRSSVHVP